MPERERHDDEGRLATVAASPAQVTAATLDLSVCIVNWNCRDVLRACLLSLRHQSLGLRYEVIVVDNASSDGAPEMILRDFRGRCTP